MGNSRSVSFGLLRIAVGVFFIVLGVYGIMQHVDESLFRLNAPKGNQTIEIVFGAVELICGLFLALGGLGILTTETARIGNFIILIFWSARIMMTKFLWGMFFSSKGFTFIPDIYTWILSFVTEILILSILILLSSKR